jgi:hypothetical protein
VRWKGKRDESICLGMYLACGLGALTPLIFDVCPRGMVTCRPAVAITNLIWSHIYRYTLTPVPPSPDADF